MRNRFLLTFIIFAVSILPEVTAQIKNSSKLYSVSWINQVVIDKENGNRLENYIAVFSKTEDSLTVYKWITHSKEKPEKIVFWTERSGKPDGVRFLSTGGADVKVTFLKENKVLVDSDLYVVNASYYDFLRQKIMVEKSVLDLAFFVKDGYGDYAVDLEPLMQKNWRNQRENLKHRIIEVNVKNKNEQTDDQFHNWKAFYKYKMNGELESIIGEYYKKKLEIGHGKRVKYLTERNLDRSYIREYSFQNPKTLLDSVSVNWTQFSTAKEFHYTEYQTKLRLISTLRKPESYDEAVKLFQIKKR